MPHLGLVGGFRVADVGHRAGVATHRDEGLQWGNVLHSVVAGVAAAQRPDQPFDARSSGQVLLEALFQLVRGKHLFGVYVVTSEFKPPKGV